MRNNCPHKVMQLPIICDKEIINFKFEAGMKESLSIQQPFEKLGYLHTPSYPLPAEINSAEQVMTI